jgi:hypothetical protein
MQNKTASQLRAPFFVLSLRPLAFACLAPEVRSIGATQGAFVSPLRTPGVALGCLRCFEVLFFFFAAAGFFVEMEPET